VVVGKVLIKSPRMSSGALFGLSFESAAILGSSDSRLIKLSPDGKGLERARKRGFIPFRGGSSPSHEGRKKTLLTLHQ
jgi:hypothetical protein